MTVYHTVWIGGIVLFSPWLVSRLLFDPRYREGLKERTGRVRPLVTDRRVVWIHGVSVGEIKAAGTVIEQLQRSRPDLHLVISSTTPTGHAVAKQLHPHHTVIYFPLDFGLFPGRALDRIAPACVLLMELEIWPNLLQAAARRNIPVAVVNGRISMRSFRGYRLVRGLLPELDLITTFCVQNPAYQQRLLELGVSPGRIHVTGNMKYDSVLIPAPEAESASLRKWLSSDGRLVLICGSTHGDEDLWVAQVLARVTERLGTPVRLVVVPRHPERASQVWDRLTGHGLAAARWSERGADRETLSSDEVLVVDTIGQLQEFYLAGDLAFVGGSLVPHGGQNMLEPAALGKVVLFGPHVGNFAVDVELLLAAGAAVQVQGLDDLQARLEELLQDPERRDGLGQKAVAFIRENRGATARTLKHLAEFLGSGAGESLENEGQDQQQAHCQQGQGN